MEEIKRRTLVVPKFPNAAACVRLVRALAAEFHESSVEAMQYLNMEPLRKQKRKPCDIWEMRRDGFSTGLTRARRSTAALALNPLPASKVQQRPLEIAECDQHNSVPTEFGWNLRSEHFVPDRRTSLPPFASAVQRRTPENWLANRQQTKPVSTGRSSLARNLGRRFSAITRIYQFDEAARLRLIGLSA